MTVLKVFTLGFLALLPAQAMADSKPVSRADMPRLEASCQGGNGNDCQALGRVYRDKEDAKAAGVKYSLETSLAYYNLGCKHGDSGACGSVNRIYAKKEFKGYDPIRAYPYFKDRCERRGEGDSHCKVMKELERDLRKPKWQKKLRELQG